MTTNQLQQVDPTPEYLGNRIRVLVDELNDNAPWFVAVDVCKAIGLPTNHVTMALRKLSPQDVCLNSIEGLRRQVNLVSEPGFYELVLGSRKPGAVAFKRWVCSDVLPAIRKYGRYEAYVDEQDEPVDIPEVMVEMVKLTERLPNGDMSEVNERLHLREWLEDHGLEGMTMKYRSAFGKICRRLMLTHDLPILSRWGSRKRDRHWKHEYLGRVYPEVIIEMAYTEYLKGRRD